MPKLAELTVPNAPDESFFETPLAQLRSITIGMEWRTHGFIANLAKAANCPELTLLDFTDSLAAFQSFDQQEPDWDSTPFNDYVALLKSPVGTKLRMLRLRNTRLTESQFRELEALNPNLQFSVIVDAPHVYVSHWDGKTFPYRHLLPFG